MDKSLRLKQKKVKKLFNITYETIRAKILGNKITAFWFSRTVNFGDLITPELIKYYGFTPVLYPIRYAELLSTGSILQRAPENYSGHILGSGLIRNTTRRFRKAKIWAVRGKLTRERIDAPIDTVLGDPGLLSHCLLKQRHDKRYSLGVVPHYIDKGDKRIDLMKKRYGDDMLVIDVMRQPSDVIEDIDKCNNIISSSLHGLIVADSLNIPNAWMYLSDKVYGRGFKFKDYFSVFGRAYRPLYLDGNEKLSKLIKYMECPPAAKVEETKNRLDSTFHRLKDHFASK